MNPLSKLQNSQLLQVAQIKKPSASKTHFAVHNPATDAVIAQVPNAKPQDALAAIASANSAWGPWRTQPARVRGDILRRWCYENSLTLISETPKEQFAEINPGFIGH